MTDAAYRFATGGDLPLPGAVEPQFAFERYARSVVEANRDLARTTKALRLRTIRVHIAGTPIGEADVRTISADDLTSYWSNLTTSEGALGNIHEVLSVTFRRAVRQGLREDNPLDKAEDVRKSRKRVRGEVRPLTTAEVERLANAASSPRDRLEILLMAYGGLRAGEVGGLRVHDIDWQRGRLHLEQQVRRISGDGLEVAGLKTRAARRIVTLPRSVMDDMRAFVDENPPTPEGLVFHGLQGGMRDAVRINASVQKAAKRAKVKTHAHALRHTAVSMWVADGASPTDVQHMVGHTDIKVTLGQYSHLFEYGGQELADSMERRREEHRNGTKR
jgi:integrase